MPRNRKMGNQKQGFTLVELLVVITIIGILMAMVFPAVGGVMDLMDAQTCRGKLSDLYKANDKYVVANSKRYPGLIERRDSNASNKPRDQITVFAKLLPNIDQADLYAIIKSGNYQSLTGGNQVSSYICPSDLDNGGAGFSTSYVANAGLDETFSHKQQSGSKKTQFLGGDGVFYDRSGPNPTRAFKKTGMNSNVILFTENVQAGYWFQPDGFENHTLLLNNVAVIWNLQKLLDPDGKSEYHNMNTPPEFNTLPLAPSLIDGKKPNLYWARPSSMHAGGANFVSTGGTSVFRDIANMDYTVYVRMMCSDWKRSTPTVSPKVQKDPKNSWLKTLPAETF